MKVSERLLIWFKVSAFQWEPVGTPFPHLFFPNCLLMYFISILNTNVSLIMRSRTSNACLNFFPSELRYYCHHYKDHYKCPTKVTTRIPLRQQRCYFVKIAAIRAYDWWVLSSDLGIQRMSTAIEHVPRPIDINNYNTKTVEGGKIYNVDTSVTVSIKHWCGGHYIYRLQKPYNNTTEFSGL